MGDGGEFMRFVTASLKVDFLRPTPIGVELEVRGRLRSLEGRKVQVSLSLDAGGQACARGEMLAVQFRD
jgi:acyl-CoA thioesterase FadM